MDLEDQLTRIVEMKEFGKYGDENRSSWMMEEELARSKIFCEEQENICCRDNRTIAIDESYCP